MDPLSFGFSLETIKHALFVLRERYASFSAPALRQRNDQLGHKDLANVATFVEDLTKAREQLDSFHAPIGRNYMTLIVTDRNIEELAKEIYESQN
jgi:cob(I)alamin adenosyltransferase